MADSRIQDLTAAEHVYPADLLVLEQGGAAKSLSGSVLIEDLLAEIGAHGGITGIAKTSTQGLVDTYTISYVSGDPTTFQVRNGKGISSVVKTAHVLPNLSDSYRINYNDGTYYDFSVDNGRSIADITWEESGTSGDGQIHTGTILYNDGTTSSVTFRDGVKGSTGQTWYVHIKYAPVEPTSSGQMSDTPDNWMGIYSGISETAPANYSDYVWNEVKGETGDTGNGIVSITLTSSSGLEDTYTVEFDDGSYTTFQVTNGSSIQSISKTGTAGLVDTYTVTLTSGDTSTFQVTNAKSIVSVIPQTNPVGVAGQTDIYRITFNDGDYVDFPVYNGVNGTGAVAAVDGIGVSDAQGNVALTEIGSGPPSALGQLNKRYFDSSSGIMYFSTGAEWRAISNMKIGSVPPTTSTQGQVGQLYYNSSSGVMYVCVGVDPSGPSYTWSGSGVAVDNALSTTSVNPVQNAVITAKVGMASLDTTATDLSGAVNELEADISWIANEVGSGPISTVAQTLVGAVNELNDYKPKMVSWTLSWAAMGYSDASIKADMVVTSIEFGDPKVITSPVAWTTANGSVSLACSITGSTSVKVKLEKV